MEFWTRTSICDGFTPEFISSKYFSTNNFSLNSTLIKFNNILLIDYFIINTSSNTCKNLNFFIQLTGNQLQDTHTKQGDLKMAKTKEAKLGIQEQIIESAGQIYNYLSNKGEVSINKMKKDLSLNENFAEMGLGWLSREDKLEYTQKAKSVTVKLR